MISRVKEFAYFDGRVAVLLGGWWWTYHDGAEVKCRLLADDGSRGPQLAARLMEIA